MTLKITAKNSAYWQNRDKYEREYILKNLADDEQLNRRLQLYYDQAIDNINQIIDSELAKTINSRTGKPSKMDVEAYQRTAKKIVQEAQLRRSQGQSVSYSDYSKAVNDHLRIYNATMRINRLEMIKSKIGLEMTRAGLNVDADLRDNLSTKYQDEINRQAGIMGESVPSSLLTSSAIAKTIMAQTNSATFSDRIWANQDALKAKLDVALTNGIIQGQNPRKIARNLKGVVSDTVKNHRYVTERIARTETARVQHQAQLESMKSTGVKYVKWMTEPKACDECQGIQMAKPTEYGSGIYELDKVPSIPVHPNCRCAIGAYWVDDENLKTDSEFIKSKIKSGEWGMKINSEKQEPHMESTRLEGKSYLFDTENPQELLEKYSGTGRIELTFNGDRTNKENIDVGRYVGIDYRSKEKVTGIRIHHSKKTYAYSSMATAEGG